MQPKHIDFDGQRYELIAGRNYYARRNWSGSGPSNLHRAIWEFHNGPIPEGHHIHHKDGDPFNNDIANLECVDSGKHIRDHIHERIASGNPPVLSQAARLANAEWQKQNRASLIAAMERRECVCVECGRAFRTPYPTRAKYCHPNCKARATFRMRRERIGSPVTPKPHLRKAPAPARGT